MFFKAYGPFQSFLLLLLPIIQERTYIHLLSRQPDDFRTLFIELQIFPSFRTLSSIGSGENKFFPSLVLNSSNMDVGM